MQGESGGSGGSGGRLSERKLSSFSRQAGIHHVPLHITMVVLSSVRVEEMNAIEKKNQSNAKSQGMVSAAGINYGVPKRVWMRDMV